MSATTAIDISKYLRSFHARPDVEYVDGELKERPWVQRSHGRLQTLLSLWFGQHEEAWGIEVAAEVRTRVSSSRVRLPDVVVDWTGDRPETLVDAPLLVIEILSPNDSYSEMQRLAGDYSAMGIENIWLIDPETRTARTCDENAWTEKTRLDIAGTPIYLDVEALFARLRPSPSAFGESASAPEEG